MDNHRACREVGCIDIEQSNPYLNNKRAFTVDRSLQGADLELKGKKKTGKGIRERDFVSNMRYNTNEVHRDYNNLYFPKVRRYVEKKLTI